MICPTGETKYFSQKGWTADAKQPGLRPYLVASFSAGTLTVFGDNASNTIIVSRDAAGTLLVNSGAVTVQGGTATVANTSLVQVFGQGGNDTITPKSCDNASSNQQSKQRQLTSHTRCMM